MDSSTEAEANLLGLINIKMIPSKAGCFLIGAYTGSLMPFLSVFFVSTGMTEMKAGILTALMYTPCIFSGPLWGFLCDYTKRPKVILVLLALGPAITMSSLPWVARYINPLSKHHCNVDNTTNGMEFFVLGTGDECRSMQSESMQTLFWILCAIVFVAAIFVFPMNSYAEAMIVNVAKRQQADYGKQRLFADIGICITSFLTGLGCEHIEMGEKMSVYAPVFFIFPVCSLMMIPLGFVLTDQAEGPTVDPIDDEKNNNQDHTDMATPLNADNRNLFNQVLHLCFQLDVFLFLMTAFVAGLMIAIYFNFSFKFLAQTSNRSKSANSLVVVISSVGSVLTFPFTTKLIHILRGNIPAIIFGLFSGCLRFLIMSLNVPFTVFLCAQLLNGFSFALLFTAMMEQVFVLSPKEINMTMNNIVMVLFFFISSLVANIAGSAIYAAYGGARLFLGTSVTAGAWALFMAVYHGLKTKVNQRVVKDSVILHNFNNIDKLMLDVA